MSYEQQNMSDQMKSKATVKEEMSEEMLGKKLKAIGSKEQLEKETESLWDYVKPLMNDLVAWYIETERKTADVDALIKETRCKEALLIELRHNLIRKEAEVTLLLTKARRTTNTMAVLVSNTLYNIDNDICERVNRIKKKNSEADATLSAAIKAKDELVELHIEAETRVDELIALHTILSKADSEVKEIEKLPVEVQFILYKLDTFLTMIKDKKDEVSVLHQELNGKAITRAPSDEGVDRALSGGGIDRVSSGEGVDRALSGEGVDRAPSGEGVDRALSGDGVDRAPSGGSIDKALSSEGVDRAPSREGVAGASSEKAIAEAEDLFHKTSCLFGLSKTKQLFYDRINR